MAKLGLSATACGSLDGITGGDPAMQSVAALWSDVPPMDTMTTVQQIEMHLQGVGESYEVEMLDPSRTRPLTIPDEMFDPKRGWRLYTAGETGAPPRRGNEA